MRRNTDIKVTFLNIFMVIGILVFLGAVNIAFANGIVQSTIVWGSIGIFLIAGAVTLRILYSKTKPEKPACPNRAMLESIVSDGVIDKEEVEKIKEMNVKKN